MVVLKLYSNVFLIWKKKLLFTIILTILCNFFFACLFSDTNLSLIEFHVGKDFLKVDEGLLVKFVINIEYNSL